MDLLKTIGAKHVVSSNAPTFIDDLTEALVATGATLAFDAVGGGRLARQILSCMEAAANRTAKEYSRYGSTVHKQIYIYGGLDRGPTELTRNFGMAWGVGGWVLTSFLRKIGAEAAQTLREQVAAEIKTTFASHYDKEISLAEALRLEEIARGCRRSRRCPQRPPTSAALDKPFPHQRNLVVECWRELARAGLRISCST